MTDERALEGFRNMLNDLKKITVFLSERWILILDRQIGCVENEFCNGGEGCFHVE